MAEFSIESKEGVRYVKAILRDETIRAEAGSLAYFHGNIRMRSPLPTIRSWMTSALAEESLFRPTYTGTGEVFFQSSMGGFHVIDLDGDEPWILSPGSYWASDGSVELGWMRERFLTAFFSGQGFAYLQTRVSGRGRVVLTCRGPIEERVLNGESMDVDGPQVVARTAGVRFEIKRPTRSILGAMTSGEGRMWVYSGTGRVLIAPVPYWRLVISERNKGLLET
jgi:uncharacterized protein (AIM24 family)